MPATIAVAPPRLRRAATAARAVGDRLLEIRVQLAATAAGLDPALGGPGARSGFAALWTGWSGSIQGLTGEVMALAGALEAAAAAYERSDRQTLPVDGLGAGGGGDDAPAR